MAPVPRLALRLAALTLACTPPAAAPEPASGTSTTATTTTGPTPTSSTADLSSSETTDAATTLAPDLFDYSACDPFTQDCPVGQKCVPYAHDDGQNWDATRCVDITGDGAPTDPCTAPEGGSAGLDDCALGSLCWDVSPDGAGTCVAQCSGSIDAPSCPTKHLCHVRADRSLALCLAICDPLTDDCGDGVCVSGGFDFRCGVDQSGAQGQANDACENANSCDDGLACLDAAAASAACDPQSAPGCCQPFCALPDGPCPNPDQQCQPWFTPNNPGPPGYYENLGVCALSQ